MTRFFFFLCLMTGFYSCSKSDGDNVADLASVDIKDAVGLFVQNSSIARSGGGSFLMQTDANGNQRPVYMTTTAGEKMMMSTSSVFPLEGDWLLLYGGYVIPNGPMYSTLFVNTKTERVYGVPVTVPFQYIGTSVKNYSYSGSRCDRTGSIYLKGAATYGNIYKFTLGSEVMQAIKYLPDNEVYSSAHYVVDNNGLCWYEGTSGHRIKSPSGPIMAVGIDGSGRIIRDLNGNLCYWESLEVEKDAASVKFQVNLSVAEERSGAVNWTKTASPTITIPRGDAGSLFLFGCQWNSARQSLFSFVLDQDGGVRGVVEYKGSELQFFPVAKIYEEVILPENMGTIKSYMVSMETHIALNLNDYSVSDWSEPAGYDIKMTGGSYYAFSPYSNVIQAYAVQGSSGKGGILSIDIATNKFEFIPNSEEGDITALVRLR